jgi:hypothetical protein
MALMPDSLRFTPAEEAQLEAIRVVARKRHQLARLAARRRGRVDFPESPYECSWAYEQEFRRKVRQ